MNGDYVIRVRPLENGFMVDVPDMEAIKKKEAESAARAKKNGYADSGCYIGDCTSSYAAKSVKEVLKLVQNALSEIPESEFDVAFAEATTAAKS